MDKNTSRVSSTFFVLIGLLPGKFNEVDLYKKGIYNK